MCALILAVVLSVTTAAPTALLLPSLVPAPNPYNPMTICAQSNLTDPDACCVCFHSTCDLVHANCPLGTGGTNLFNYFDMQYCALSTVSWVSYTILTFWLLIVFSLLGTTADNFFVVQLETISSQLKLSPSTAAITLLALGNSAPDVFSDLAAVQENNDFNIAMGELVGASMFLTNVVLAAVIFTATTIPKKKKDVVVGVGVGVGVDIDIRPPPECTVNREPIRDILSFFIVLALVLSFCIDDSRITFVEASLLIGAYVIYVSCVIIYTKKCTKKSDLHRRSSLFNNQGGGGGGGGGGQKTSMQQSMEEALLASGAAVRNSSGEMQAVVNPTVSDDYDDDDDDDDDEEDEQMVGFDWDPDATTFEKVTFFVEYPFSILRWLTIASADQQWSKRRRYLSSVAPQGMVAVVFLDFSANWTGGEFFFFFFFFFFLKKKSLFLFPS